MDRSHLEKAHPNERVYIKVAVVLAVVTAVEIWISYTHYPDWIKIASLLLLSIVKFSAVAMFFMHLKFDHPALRKPFLAGLTLALTVYTIVVLNLLLHSA